MNAGAWIRRRSAWTRTSRRTTPRASRRATLIPSPLELAARGRRDAEDARRLKQWKCDPEVYAQIERSIAARHEREQEIDRRESRKAERKAEILEAERNRARLADAVVAHALRELHRLLMRTGGAVAAAGARQVRSNNPRRSRRAWQGRPAAECSPHGFSPRVVIALTPLLSRACSRGRWLRGAVPGGSVRCCRSGTAR